MAFKVGYACISKIMRDKGVYTNRTLILKSITDELPRAKGLAMANVLDLIEIIAYNESVGIRFFRLTSELFPHLGNPRAPQYDIDFALPELHEAGALARSLGHRITMHPGQFAQLGSPREEVVVQTIVDLTNHAKILLAMGMRPELGSVIIIHGGGVYGNKKETLERWVARYKTIPDSVRQFIVLENDDYHYTVHDLLPVCEQLGVPLCLDFFHHKCNNVGPVEPLYERVIALWRKRGIKPKCHVSGQAPNSRKGAHSKCLARIPDEVISYCSKYDVDLMVEAKDKDECVLSLLRKQFSRIVVDGRVEWLLDTKK